MSDRETWECRGEEVSGEVETKRSSSKRPAEISPVKKEPSVKEKAPVKEESRDSAEVSPPAKEESPESAKVAPAAQESVSPSVPAPETLGEKYLELAQLIKPLNYSNPGWGEIFTILLDAAVVTAASNFPVTSKNLIWAIKELAGEKRDDNVAFNDIYEKALEILGEKPPASSEPAVMPSEGTLPRVAIEFVAGVAQKWEEGALFASPTALLAKNRIGTAGALAVEGSTFPTLFGVRVDPNQVLDALKNAPDQVKMKIDSSDLYLNGVRILGEAVSQHLGELKFKPGGAVERGAFMKALKTFMPLYRKQHKYLFVRIDVRGGQLYISTPSDVEEKQTVSVPVTGEVEPEGAEYKYVDLLLAEKIPTANGLIEVAFTQRVDVRQPPFLGIGSGRSLLILGPKWEG